MTLRIAHVINGLERGGAETFLVQLLTELRSRGCSSLVFSLADRGSLAPELDALGVQVHPLGLPAGGKLVGALPAMIAAARAFKTDLVQGCLPHGNVFALAGAALLRRPAVWVVQQSLNTGTDRRYTKRTTAAVIQAGARLSRFTRAIVYVTRNGQRDHEAIGYHPERSVVIPNGVDLGRFSPNPSHRSSVRRELGLPCDALLVGMAARWHPMKDHATFLRAAGQLVHSGTSASFVLAGREVDRRNGQLLALVRELGIEASVHLLGERDDMPRVTAALDVACLSSVSSEGMPLALGEAMASCVPCVATDVGDSDWLVGETGRIVPSSDPGALAAALRGILTLSPHDRGVLGLSARARIADHFSIEAVADQYLDLYERVLNGH